MCCRYGYETGTERDVEEIADWISPSAKDFRKGDVHPSESAVILKAGPEKEENQWAYLVKLQYQEKRCKEERESQGHYLVKLQYQEKRCKEERESQEHYLAIFYFPKNTM